MAAKRIDIGGTTLQAIENDGMVVARGIPYARADRFADPEVVSPGAEVIDGTERGPACPQLPSRLQPVTGPVVDCLPVSEQCQVLSVFAPADAERLPVMVWFHGGAYVSGGGESPKYDPLALVAEGRVVVVTVTYRLGIFGYLNIHDPHTQNLGLRDQICALQWVRDNVSAFGGDPQRVTVFGQSAGGDSVMSLMLCPETAGLFTRAILQSAPLGLPRERSALAAAMTNAALASLAGVPAMEADIQQLLEAQVAALVAAQPFGRLGMMAYAPILGHAPLVSAEQFEPQIADAARRVEILVGYTRDDGRPFVSMDPRGARLQRFGPLGTALAAVIARNLTRTEFGRPAIDLAQTWQRAGGRSATFRVDWAPPRAPLGACHCIELPLLLGAVGAWTDAPMLGPEPRTVDENLGRQMRFLWAGFAHDGVAALGQRQLVFG
ncbi:MULTISPECIES: carboxylesterase family protein [Mycobacteriaceae]|uniref:Carboxylic ester hydrolase n=1 Tax=Mycolicibacterium mucogenicum DSM 44124 TaxID=1226753 RepID=A0A8H2PJ47_MYCMU|nr:MULTISPECIES: carboxylesterase family protein [Mycobacteriaceae]KAB7755424.1 para-nitrobenzyl esterase [Mycolicibacterium mucogenicum DSM 44124]QPG68163.1 carboxylesterase family protein [Mycolicibacterium mucogenicum DSM 44124]SEB25346.1 para-nitrobenzyl esterase [Mycobacterium sp. 283mftsu]